ncbi:DUF4268 domain-containing protein [Propionimicrobium sp. PCR01-08-3]|uniref:DUF4268 domain-containing protein n=1 Tax=Propionimicrobium sp. PCR01-08-3 TaxID=3052086 RepID=UPI00255C7081|nr:DUF4268 domain-containing protein [Propionimicrobium sp. PCR01-08-3]WIY83954.1 DUF4268 domain-containing protein [Propionimicrobium sp. PCR01-08-3]
MVQAKETNLEGVLEGRKQYVVPLFQRPYSWKREQIDRLWADLIDIARTRRTSPDATHFIGSLVLAVSPGVGAVGMNEFLVVDGQQRLTTLTLLLAALRDHLVETVGGSEREGIDTQYLINRFDKGAPTKFLPTQDDRQAYEAIIRSLGNAGDGTRIEKNYNHLKAKLAKLNNEDGSVSAKELEDAILRGLELVAVQAEQSDNAHRIFESLNNTGMPLTQADLLKNYLFMRLGDNRTNAVYQSIWRPLEQKLAPKDLELLFWLDLVFVDENAKQTDTYAGQQKRLDRLATPSEIENEISRIAALGDVLVSILEPSRESDPEIRIWLERIKAWGSTTAYPIVLRILARRAAGTATAEQATSAFHTLISYFVRRVVIGRATAGINKTLLQAVAAVGDEPDVAVALRSYLSNGRKYFGTDAQVREAVGTVDFYHNGRKAQQNLILRWLEESYEGKETTNLTGLTIEHVLPQTLSEETRDEFAETLDGDADLVAEHGRIVHTIGNLTLTGYNSELSNRPFAIKRDQLGKSPLEMNKTIAAHESWGTEEILSRGAKLADRIISLWPGPDESVAEPVPNDGLPARIAQVIDAIPPGRWTSYTELAVVVGSHPVAVGAAVANNATEGAWRVMTHDGRPSAQFRWNDSNRTDRSQNVLAAEGITFDESGRASDAKFMDARALADTAGVGIDDVTISARRKKITTKYSPRDGHSRPQLQYWTMLKNWCEQNAPHLAVGRTPRARTWYDISIGCSGINISLTVSSVGKRLQTQLWIADNKPLFGYLLARRDDVEAELGYPVEWDDKPGRMASKIIATHEGDFQDVNDRSELVSWHGRTADDFGRVFPSYIKRWLRESAGGGEQIRVAGSGI